MLVLNTLSPSVKFGLHFAGIWPATPFPYLHKLGWLAAIAALQSYQYRYIVMHYKSDNLMSIIDNLSIAMPFSLVFIKLIVTWINHGYVIFCF